MLSKLIMVVTNVLSFIPDDRGDGVGGECSAGKWITDDGRAVMGEVPFPDPKKIVGSTRRRVNAYEGLV